MGRFRCDAAVLAEHDSRIPERHWKTCKTSAGKGSEDVPPGELYQFRILPVGSAAPEAEEGTLFWGTSANPGVKRATRRKLDGSDRTGRNRVIQILLTAPKTIADDRVNWCREAAIFEGNRFAVV